MSDKPREWTLEYDANFDFHPPVVTDGPDISPEENEVRVIEYSAYETMQSRAEHAEVYVKACASHKEVEKIIKERDEARAEKERGFQVSNELIEKDRAALRHAIDQWDYFCEELNKERARSAKLVEALRKYKTAIDDLYNHNEAVRTAVIERFGLHHSTEVIDMCDSPTESSDDVAKACAENYYDSTTESK